MAFPRPARPLDGIRGPRLTVVGCQAGMPSPGWPSSSYLVETSGTTLLFDCGPGAATALGAHVEPDAVSAAFLSHIHLDHCFDLVVVGKQIVYRSRGIGRDRIPLYVPPGTARVLRALNRLLPIGPEPSDTMPLDRVFDEGFAVVEYEPGQAIPVGDTVVTPVAMRHVIPSHGFRIETPGGTMAYSGDTGVTDAFDALARDVDLLLVEATLPEPDTSGHGHLSAAEAGHIATAFGARRLVLTHLMDPSPTWLAAQRARAAAEYRGPLRVATPGVQFELDAPSTQLVPTEEP